MKTMRSGTGWACWIVLAGALLSGCDEPVKEATKKLEAATEVAPAALAPAPAPAPVPEPEPPKPQKKFEDCPKGNKVALDNEELEGSIRVKAQKREGDLTTADLRRLRSLNLSRIPLDELDVCLFYHMTELRELFLAPGKLTDLSPLARATKLESFGASSNPISDLSPLEKMTKMDRLDLAHTKVVDLSVLSHMPALTEINVDDTAVEDLTPLGELKQLERLSVKRTKVSDVKMLADHKKLRFIYINGSPLHDEISKTGILVQNGTKVIMD